MKKKKTYAKVPEKHDVVDRKLIRVRVSVGFAVIINTSFHFISFYFIKELSITVVLKYFH